MAPKAKESEGATGGNSHEKQSVGNAPDVELMAILSQELAEEDTARRNTPQLPRVKDRKLVEAGRKVLEAQGIEVLAFDGKDVATIRGTRMIVLKYIGIPRDMEPQRFHLQVHHQLGPMSDWFRHPLDGRLSIQSEPISDLEAMAAVSFSQRGFLRPPTERPRASGVTEHRIKTWLKTQGVEPIKYDGKTSDVGGGLEGSYKYVVSVEEKPRGGPPTTSYQRWFLRDTDAGWGIVHRERVQDLEVLALLGDRSKVKENPQSHRNWLLKRLGLIGRSDLLLRELPPETKRGVTIYWFLSRRWNPTLGRVMPVKFGVLVQSGLWAGRKPSWKLVEQPLTDLELFAIETALAGDKAEENPMRRNSKGRHVWGYWWPVEQATRLPHGRGYTGGYGNPLRSQGPLPGAQGPVQYTVMWETRTRKEKRGGQTVYGLPGAGVEEFRPVFRGHFPRSEGGGWQSNDELLQEVNRFVRDLRRMGVREIVVLDAHGNEVVTSTRSNPPPSKPYDPREEQLRAQRQGIYESSVRKALGVPYNTPFRDPQTGLRLDLQLPIRKRVELAGRMFAIGTTVPAKYGRLRPGTQSVTARTAEESRARYADVQHLVENRQDYEETIAMGRKSGFYRVTVEPVGWDGHAHFIWPMPPNSSGPYLSLTSNNEPASFKEAEAEAAELNRTADPRKTGIWWVPRTKTGAPRAWTRESLSHWLPPDEVWSPQLVAQPVAVGESTRTPRTKRKPRKARR